MPLYEELVMLGYILESSNKVWYHGSNTYFKKFERRSKTVVDFEQDNAMFFTDNEQFAANNGTIVYKVHLNVNKTFTQDMVFIEGYPQKQYYLSYDNLTNIGKSLYKLYEDELDEEDDILNILDAIDMCKWDIMESKIVQLFLQNNGFDSFNVTGDTDRSIENIAVFDPNKINIIETYIKKNSVGSDYLKQQYPELEVK